MNIKSKLLKGGFWTSVSTAFTMLIQFARIMILTRFLAKSDFGIVSIVNMVIGLCISFSDLGFSSIIMYKKELTKKEFSSLYWIQWIIYLGAFFIIVIVAPLIARLYHDTILQELVPISAFSLICMSLGKLYESVLQKRYEFKKIAFRNIVTNVLSLVLAVWLAYKGYGVYSLIFSTIFQILMYNIWTLFIGYIYQPVEFVLCFAEIKPLIKMGLYQTYTRIADFISSKIDIIIIGNTLGMEVLGVYDLSKELVLKFVNFVRSVVSQIALPFISNSNTDENVVRDRFLLITKLIALICIPICATLLVFSKEILWLVYGPNYVDAKYVVSIFALVSIASCITSFFDMLGIAKGRTDLNFKNTIYRIMITTPIIMFASQFSITILALSQIPITAIMIAIFWRTVVLGTYPIKVKIYFKQFRDILFLTFIVSIAFFLINNNEGICFENSPVLVVIVFALYIITLFVTYTVFLKEDIRFLKKIILRT